MRLDRKESLCSGSVGPEIQIEEFPGFVLRSALEIALGYLPTAGFINEIIKPASGVAHGFFNAASNRFVGYYIHGQGLYCGWTTW